MTHHADPSARRRAFRIARLVALMALAGLTWPLLSLPLAACEQQLYTGSPQWAEACAIDPLLYLFTLWLALIGALALFNRGGSRGDGADQP